MRVRTSGSIPFKQDFIHTSFPMRRAKAEKVEREDGEDQVKEEDPVKDEEMEDEDEEGDQDQDRDREDDQDGEGSEIRELKHRLEKFSCC